MSPPPINCGTLYIDCPPDKGPGARVEIGAARWAANLVRMAIKNDEKKVPTPGPAQSSDEQQGHPEVAGATALGAATAGMAGAAIGTAIGGPIGGVVGAAVGSAAGGLGAHAVEHRINPTVEDAYWRKAHPERSYAEANLPYDEHWRPAYRHGWEARMMYGNREWEQLEPDLEKSWTERRGHSALDWAKAKLATRDAWDRLEGREGHDPEHRRDH